MASSLRSGTATGQPFVARSKSSGTTSPQAGGRPRPRHAAFRLNARGSTEMLSVRHEARRERHDSRHSLRVSRAIRLAVLIQSHDGALDRPALQTGLSVSRRTFYRDLRILRTAGLSIQYSKRDQRYHLTDPGPCLSEGLTVDECAALLVFLAECPGLENGAEAERILRSAKRKTMAALSQMCQPFEGEVRAAIAAFSGRKLGGGPPTVTTGVEAGLEAAQL